MTLRVLVVEDGLEYTDTLERFLGDKGALRAYVGELFDETKRDSAIGRMRTLLGTYFDGDASKLATASPAVSDAYLAFATPYACS